MFQCERLGEIRSFETFSECRSFVSRQGDRNKLWSYIGAARLSWSVGEASDYANLLEFFKTTMAIDAAEQEYFTRSHDVDNRWETADREEFDDLTRASREIDEMRERRIELRFALAHLLIPVESAR